MHLSKFVHTQTGRYMMSIILGIGLAALFRASCKGKNCVLYNAPPMEEIEDKIYKFDDKCYKFEKSSVKCNKNKQVVNFA